jgi:diadenylate cyclase
MANYNFYKYFTELDWYAVIDALILIVAVAVLFVFFHSRRNYRALLILFAVGFLEILVHVLSDMADHEILTVARYVTHYAVIMAIVIMVCAYASDWRGILQKLSAGGRGSLFRDKVNSTDELEVATGEILTAVMNMAKQNIGAILIIDTAKEIKETVLDTGTILEAKLTARLLESVFFPKTPLHDGAVIIRGNEVLAAGCFLPLTTKNINKEMGTRHRAALGITESTGATVIVVSEESGIISLAKEGVITRYMTMDKLKPVIQEAFGIGIKTNKSARKNI